MKAKKLVTLLAATATLATLLTGCGSKATEATQTVATDEAATEAQTEAVSEEAAAPSGDFNPDEEAGVSIEEIRESNGAVPVKAGTKAGVVAKAFENEYWRTLKEGYEAGAKYITDAGFEVSVDVQAPQGETDEQGQLAIVNNMINQSYDMLLLSPISDANLTPAVEVANEEGIPVLNVNDGLIAKAPYFVGPKAYQNGELAAEWISDKLSGEGQVAIVIGMPKAFAARQRTAGFEDWMGSNASGIEIVAKQNADWDRQASKELAETWMQQYPDLKAIFCNNDTMALGVVEAVEEQGADIIVVGVDGIGEAYTSIREGKLDATIDSFPYYKAQIALECGLRAMAGQDVPRVVWTPQALIDSTNVDANAEEIINWTPAEYVAE
ncbi:MAG: substrate-binding domain-containing protein [Lachnospiraceae bacterium]|nr:substrate-binding domain-containing protein [Lachnospiraceae bacterium]